MFHVKKYVMSLSRLYTGGRCWRQKRLMTSSNVTNIKLQSPTYRNFHQHFVIMSEYPLGYVVGKRGMTTSGNILSENTLTVKRHIDLSLYEEGSRLN